MSCEYSCEKEFRIINFQRALDRRAIAEPEEFAEVPQNFSLSRDQQGALSSAAIDRSAKYS